MMYLTKSIGDAGHHLREHVEAFALPLDRRIYLAVGPQVDALAEVVHLVEMLAPVLIDEAQHDLTLDVAAQLGADELLALFVVARAPRP